MKPLIFCLLLFSQDIQAAFCTTLTNESRAFKNINSNEDSDWTKVRSLAEKAFQLLSKERDPTLIDKRKALFERKAAFREAAQALEVWVDKYLASKKDSVRYVRALFTSGYYNEYAFNLNRAYEFYKQCKNHPRLNDPGATYKNQRIANILEARLGVLANAVPLMATIVLPNDELLGGHDDAATLGENASPPAGVGGDRLAMEKAFLRNLLLNPGGSIEPVLCDLDQIKAP
jgi:tetratricopeptide (TPR) repeat protein